MPLADCSAIIINGTCKEPPPPDDPQRAVWIRGVNDTRHQAMMTGTQATTTTFATSSESSENGDQWAWTLQRIHPTAFNVASDLFSYFTRVVIGGAIATLYAALLTWQIHLRRPVPLAQLGELPRDAMQGLVALPHWQWSLPALSLVALLLVADFSHSVADVGLKFPNVPVEGPPEPVLVVASDKRNHQRPMEMAGKRNGSQIYTLVGSLA